MRLLPTILAPVLLLGACASPPKLPEAEAPAPSPAAKPPPLGSARPTPKQAKPGPIPTRAISVKAECSFRDETGYNGALKLAIEEARVQAFEATVNIPRQGTCRFDMRNFRQTRDLPTVELRHVSDRCVVRVWEQGERVTVAFQQCQKMCSSSSAWERLWPILTDRKDGSCA